MSKSHSLSVGLVRSFGESQSSIGGVLSDISRLLEHSSSGFTKSSFEPAGEDASTSPSKGLGSGG